MVSEQRKLYSTEMVNDIRKGGIFKKKMTNHYLAQGTSIHFKVARDDQYKALLLTGLSQNKTKLGG